jgi:hypothetical protein
MSTKQNVLIEYLYRTKLTSYIDYTKLGPVAKINKDKFPVGVVIAIGPSVMGWALCDKKDKFNKEKALELALGRADLVACIEEDSLENFYLQAVPFSLGDLLLKMNERSLKYYKED